MGPELRTRERQLRLVVWLMAMPAIAAALAVCAIEAWHLALR